MTPWWFLVFFAIFLIGVTKSGFGAGVGLMIVPMTVVAMGHTPYTSAAALGVMLPLLVFGDLIAVAQHRGHFDWANVRRLAVGSVIGIAIGGALLWWFHQQQHLVVPLIKLEVGLESVILVGLHWYRTWHGLATDTTPGPIKSTATGIFAGASSTLAHAAGPIIALYLLPQRLDRRVFVGTCAIYFFLVNTAKLPAYGKSEMFSPATLWLALYLSPLVIAGAVFGFWVNRKLNDEVFARIVYLMTFLLGWYLIWDGVRGLMG